MATQIQLSRKWLGRGQGGGEGGFKFGSPRASEATLPLPGDSWVVHPSILHPAGSRASLVSQDFGSALTRALTHPVVKAVCRRDTAVLPHLLPPPTTLFSVFHLGRKG